MYCLHYFALLAVTLNNTIMETKKLTELKLGEDYIIHKDPKTKEIVAKLIKDINIVLDGEEENEENPWHWEVIEGTDRENCDLFYMIEEFPGDLIIDYGNIMSVSPNDSYFQVKGDMIIKGMLHIEDERLEEMGWMSILGDLKVDVFGIIKGDTKHLEISGEIIDIN